MRKWVLSVNLIALAAMLAGCSGSSNDGSQNSDNAFAGSYSGTYSGDDEGVFEVEVASDGTITGSGLSLDDDESFGITGSVSGTGSLRFVTGAAATATFTGTISEDGEVAGTWSATDGARGAFEGSRAAPPPTPGACSSQIGPDVRGNVTLQNGVLETSTCPSDVTEAILFTLSLQAPCIYVVSQNRSDVRLDQCNGAVYTGCVDAVGLVTASTELDSVEDGCRVDADITLRSNLERNRTISPADAVVSLRFSGTCTMPRCAVGIGGEFVRGSAAASASAARIHELNAVQRAVANVFSGMR